jgi:hypothetical protein
MIRFGYQGPGELVIQARRLAGGPAPANGNAIQRLYQLLARRLQDLVPLRQPADHGRSNIGTRETYCPGILDVKTPGDALKSHQYQSPGFQKTYAYWLDKNGRKVFVLLSTDSTALQSTLDVIGRGMNEGNSWFVFNACMEYLEKEELRQWTAKVGLPVVTDVGFAHQRQGYSFRPPYDADPDYDVHSVITYDVAKMPDLMDIKIEADVPWIYWARALSLSFLASNMQQMIPVLRWQKLLTNPLRAELVEEVDDRVSRTVTELFFEKGKSGWEGRDTKKH